MIDKWFKGWRQTESVLRLAAKISADQKPKKSSQLHILLVALLTMALTVAATAATVSTTTVQGTVYLANGQPAGGSVTISWPAFTTANGQAVAADSITLTIGTDGFLSVNLAPNVGSMPAGEYYTAIFHLSDGSTSTQYWVVPATAQATLASVQAQVMPAAQAVQTVSKAYVDQAIAELSASELTATGGTLTGPLYLSGDPTQPLQAADKHYVDVQMATAEANSWPAQVLRADQFSGADFGAKLQACVNALSTTYGGTCDARNFTGSLTMASSLTIATGNVAVLLPCATITTASQIVVTAGTRNVSLHGCALRGGTSASGSTGGTALAYTGSSAAVVVGDPAYAVNTPGFHLDNLVINTTGAASASAQGLAAYRTQEMDIESVYFLGNSNQTGMTLDGTNNYTGGTFFDDQFSGFGIAVNAIGHQAGSTTVTDWMNASTFLRLHIDCPTSSGNPISGTIGINLLQGDGNTFTGGDVEGCGTALHLGSNAQNNTIVGLRNENSINQVVADLGSAYNSWITGGTMYNGKLTDNGTRNSFLDTFHRSFNALNGDWYGSQTDATLTNHFRLGNGAGNERGLLNEIQTDYGYRWIYGFSDATGGQQLYQLQDLLNNVYRLQVQQWNSGQSSTNNQTALNAAGTGNVCFNCSANSGTGGVTFASGGASPSAVATVDSLGNGQFVGNLLVGGTTQSTGNLTVRNSADAQIGLTLWPGLTGSQKGVVTFKDWNGNSQWYLVKDTSNNWALNSATGGLDSFKAYQSTNSGDTYINTSNSSGHIRLNYENGSGAETDIYSNASLDAAFQAPNSIKLPGLAATTGHDCVQIDNSGYLSNTGSPCGTGSGGTTGTINTGTTGQVAYYTTNGTVLGGTSAVPLTAGGTGATSASGALTNLLPGASSDGKNGLSLQGNLTAAQAIPSASPYADIRAFGAVIDATTDIGPAVQSAIGQCPTDSGTGGVSCTILLPCTGVGCYWGTQTHINPPSDKNVVVKVQGKIQMGNTLQQYPGAVLQGENGGTGIQFQNRIGVGQIMGANVAGTLGTAIPTINSAQTFTPAFTSGGISKITTDSWITVIDPVLVATSGTVTRTAFSSGYNVSATLSSYTRIVPGSIITITGCADSSFNVANTFVVNVVNQSLTSTTLYWSQPTQGAGTTTGCTIAGWNYDTFESVNITAVGASTLTAVFQHTHLASARFGLAAMAFPGYLGPYEMDNITVQDAPGAQIVLPQANNLTWVGVGAQANAAVTSVPVDANLLLSTIRDSTFISSLINPTSCSSAANCNEPSYPLGAFRCTFYTSGGASALQWSGCGYDDFRDNTFYGGLAVDNNEFNGGAVAVPNLYDNQFRKVPWHGVTIDTRYGSSSQFVLDAPVLEDNDLANGQCFVGVTDLNVPHGNATLSLNRFESPDTTCVVSQGFRGGVIAWPTDSMSLPTGRYGNPVGTFDSGGILLTEFRGQDAGLGPSVIPFATQTVRTDIASQCSAAGSCTAKSVLAPDGTTNAVEIDTAGASNNPMNGAGFLESTYAGDWILYGSKVRQGANQDHVQMWHGSYAFSLATAGADTLLGSTPDGYQMQMSRNDGWQSVVGLAQVQTGDSSSHYLILDLWPGASTGAGNQFFDWFAIYVPGPNNPAYSGVTLDMVEQWRRELLHGTVPSNWNHPGVAVTTEPISASSYLVNGTALATGNLADWTNSGVASGSVPMWNASTGKWTPGTLPGSVSSINGSSGAFTLTGSGISCSGTTCTVAGSSASSNVQAASQYSPAYYSASGSSNTLSGVAPFTGLGYWSASAPPAAATAAQIVSAIGSTPVANATNATSATSAATATTATNFSGSLAGDVTGTQSATTVGKINGSSVPASAAVLSTNSSSQLAAATTTGSGNVVLATSPALSAPTVSGTLAGAAETLSGALSVTGTTTLTGAATMQSNVSLQNGADATQTLTIQPGTSAEQIGAVQFNNYTGSAKWQVRKDANNYLRVTDSANSLDRVILPPNANTTINSGAGSTAVVLNNTSGSGTSGFIVYEGGTNYTTAAFQVTGSGNTTATGFLQGKFIIGSGTMTMAAGAAAGSSPTIACATSHTCDGVSGAVTLTTGTSPATGTLATLSFPNTHANQANCIVTTTSSSAQITTNTWTESTTAITITANSALSASTAYTIRYWCGGY